MTKGNVTQVEENGGKLKVTVKDTLMGEDLEVDVDMVVLAAGMEPTTKDAQSINLAYRQGPCSLISTSLTDMPIRISSAFPMKPEEPAFMPVAAYVRPQPWMRPLTMLRVRH